MSSEMDADATTTLRSDQPPPPPSRWQHDDSSASGQSIRLMCSFGGRILARPQDQQLRYVGGETRIIAIPRSASFSTLLTKLSKIAGSSVSAEEITIKYQLPNEDLDALISLTSDEDVDNMMDEYDRLSASRTPRLRLFLFYPGADLVSSVSLPGSAFGSILDGSGGSKRDDWFFDALNGTGAPTPLERGRSEASSIISEVPDYLFGFDNNSDETPPAASHAGTAQANLYLSDPDITNLPLLETKQSGEVPVEPQIHLQTVANPVWHYVADQMPVYYVPGPMMPGGSLPVQPMPMSFPFAHLPAGGPAQVGYAQPVHGAPFYVGGTPMMAAAYEYPMPAKTMPGEAYEVLGARGLIRNPASMPLYQPAGVAPAGAELPMPSGSDFKGARTSQ